MFLSINYDLLPLQSNDRPYLDLPRKNMKFPKGKNQTGDFSFHSWFGFLISFVSKSWTRNYCWSNNSILNNIHGNLDKKALRAARLIFLIKLYFSTKIKTKKGNVKIESMSIANLIKVCSIIWYFKPQFLNETVNFIIFKIYITLFVFERSPWPSRNSRLTIQWPLCMTNIF